MENLGGYCFRELLRSFLAAKMRVKNEEPRMNTKFIAAIAVLTAGTATLAFAQGQAVPKASKADVQKLVDSIKGDNTKLTLFCNLTKLASQSGALAEKNRYDPKLLEFEKQIDDISAKLGPDYEKITDSEMDEVSAAPLAELSKSCK